MNSSGEFVAITDEYEYNDISNINQFVAYKNPFRYRSYYYDFETGLYYLNSRYYDPELGRFVNADDIDNLSPNEINGINLFAYCVNNPVNLSDECGHAWWHWLIAALVVVIAAVAVVVTAGGAAAGMAAVAAVAAGCSAATLGSTIAAGVFIGAVTAFAAFSVIAGIDAIGTLANGGSFEDALNTFSNYGETALYATVGGGVAGGISAGLSYSGTTSRPKQKTSGNGLDKKSVNRAVKATLKNSNKMHHIMQAKHNLPNSVKEIGKLMRSTLLNGQIGPYKKSALSATWNGYEVTFKIIEKIIRISDMWRK